ncbi:MAG: Mut7-C RNAse domain-containing protein [Candidatus Aminicenantales bacterium]
MNFVADCMLGKLAKWLRILGFDTVYLNKAEDLDLLLIARRQQRILLTKDHRLLETAKDVRSLFIKSDDWPEQLVQVLDTYGLRDAVRPHSRCLACNVKLKAIPKTMAGNLVTPFVLERAASFAVCPSCERVYWPGTHFRDMDATIERILRKAGAPRKSGKRKKEHPERITKKI